jgi:hypothetical protein
VSETVGIEETPNDMGEDATDENVPDIDRELI